MRKDSCAGLLLTGLLILIIGLFVFPSEQSYDIFNDEGVKIGELTQAEYNAIYNPQSQQENVVYPEYKVLGVMDKVDNMDEGKKERLKNKAENVYSNLSEEKKQKLRGVYDGLSDDTKSKIKSFLGR